MSQAPIAQLDNASASEAGDCAFESRWVRHKYKVTQNATFCIYHGHSAIWTRRFRGKNNQLVNIEC